MHCNINKYYYFLSCSDPQYRNLADVRAEDITHLSNGISFEKKLAYFLDSSVGMEKVDVSHKEYEVSFQGIFCI